MGCILALLAWISPRFALFLMWVFSDRLTVAFDSFLIGALGFVLLPYTAAMYALAYQPRVGVSGFGYILVGFAILMDLGSWGFGGDKANRRRQQRA